MLTPCHTITKVKIFFQINIVIGNYNLYFQFNVKNNFYGVEKKIKNLLNLYTENRLVKYAYVEMVEIHHIFNFIET